MPFAIAAPPPDYLTFLSEKIGVDPSRRFEFNIQLKCCPKMMNAYIAAFQEKSDGRISHELVKKIHKIAMSHLRTSSSDEYKQESNHFAIAIAEYSEAVVPTYSATANGIKQFVTQWIDNPKTGTHSISFIPKDRDPAKPIYVIQRLKGQLTLHTTDSKKNALSTDKDKIMSIILAALKLSPTLVFDLICARIYNKD